MTTEQADRDYERTGNDPHGIHTLQPCTRAGHVEFCAGSAGGEHQLREGWIAFEDDGQLVEVEVAE